LLLPLLLAVMATSADAGSAEDDYKKCLIVKSCG